MGILEGKKILVTGVLTEASIAFATARLAQEQGATVVLSNFDSMPLFAPELGLILGILLLIGWDLAKSGPGVNRNCSVDRS